MTASVPYVYEHQIRLAKLRRIWTLLFFFWSFVGAWGPPLLVWWILPFDGAKAFEWMVWSGVFMTLLIYGGAYVRSRKLVNEGGFYIASRMGAYEVVVDTKDPNERRLWRLSEEMALAASIPSPTIYVLKGERAINALAAGWGIRDQIIVVTEGALVHLDDRELQALLAHEFAHIASGDTRFNMRISGLLFGLTLLPELGHEIMLLSVKDRMNGEGAAALLLGGLIMATIGGFFLLIARILQGFANRKREWLADATAVQFTRYNVGLAGVLKKAMAIPPGTRVHRAELADQLGHFFFGDGKESFSEAVRWYYPWTWVQTHPALIQRIRAVDPHFESWLTLKLKPLLGCIYFIAHVHKSKVMKKAQPPQV